MHLTTTDAVNLAVASLRENLGKQEMRISYYSSLYSAQQRRREGGAASYPRCRERFGMQCIQNAIRYFLITCYFLILCFAFFCGFFLLVRTAFGGGRL